MYTEHVYDKHCVTHKCDNNHKCNTHQYADANKIIWMSQCKALVNDEICLNSNEV